jgi:nickel transport protein
MIRHIFAPIIMAVFFLFPETAFGHGVEVSDITGSTPGLIRTVHFKYSTGEPMMYATIKLYPPSKPDVEVLQSITDRKGLFCFVPDEEGEWIVEAADGMGHKGTIAVHAGETVAGNSAPPDSGKTPLFIRIMLGLSLILNIFAFYNFVLPRIRGFGKKACI